MSRDTLQQINVGALIRLKAAHQERLLTRHQYRTLRGQVFAGDAEGAMRWLKKLLRRQETTGPKSENVSR